MDKDWVLVKQADCEDSIAKSSDSEESDDSSISIINLADSRSEEDNSTTNQQKELHGIGSISTETYQQEKEGRKDTDAVQTEKPFAQPISCDGSIIDEKTDKHEEITLHVIKEAISYAAKGEELMESKELTSVEGAIVDQFDSAEANSQSVPDEFQQHSQTIISHQNAACEEKMQPASQAQECPRDEEKLQKKADLKVKLTQHVESSKDALVVCEKLSVLQNESNEKLERNTCTVTTAIPQEPAPLLKASGMFGHCLKSRYMWPGTFLAVIPELAAITTQVDSNPEEIGSFAETPLGLHSDKSSAPSEESILDNKLLDHSSDGLLPPTIKERSIKDKKAIPDTRSFLGNSRRRKAKANRKCFATDKTSSKEFQKTSSGSQVTKRASITKPIKRNTGDIDPNRFAIILSCIVGVTFVLFLIDLYLLHGFIASEDPPKQEEKVSFYSSTVRRIKGFGKMNRFDPNDWAFDHASRLKQRNKLRYGLRNER